MRASDPFLEFDAIRRFNRSDTPGRLRRQEARYRSDAGFVAHVGSGRARMLCSLVHDGIDMMRHCRLRSSVF